MKFPRRLNKRYWMTLSRTAAIWCLPIWVYVIIDAVRRSEGMPVLWKGIQNPGKLLSWILTTDSLWAAMHDYTWKEVCIYSCLFYYVVVALVVMMWRRIRRARRETSQAK